MEETKESDEDESYCVLAALLPAKARAIKNEVVQQAYAGEAHERSWHMLGGKQRSVGNTDRRSSAVGAKRDLAAEGRRGHARAAHSSRAKRWLRASEASDGLFAGEGSLGNLPDSEH
ncbi:hypothetical protein PF005_g4838 [Phytophthora fragariae]|uniref:Uncharacterized protein n=1 Tax=Phytophthora fragariae TaxID=53985 RepID=A0A6A3ZU20_9STRA|nr:hypothetical protein PF003_g1958 [Phytophthora fragariae]KAE8944953.1 hypothetical protein PF009_g5392 [Phytophthora fragariae]KAE9080678.1 hypothetical protein PF010_g22291 [Phytophthora fragariae]KAE9125926.1 hypothetical protein PF007_g6172 [Phytophthora fragariae]KAE9147249.1 hypothetical protein PF006_g8047 [Phytophthora fragariae]